MKNRVIKTFLILIILSPLIYSLSFAQEELANEIIEEKIDQIRVNLERARWVFHKLSPDFIAVDIAGFRVYDMEGININWSSRVQVGKPFRKTPVFKSKIEYIVFNPTWTVPPSILQKDILPKIKKNPDYLRKMNQSEHLTSPKFL